MALVRNGGFWVGLRRSPRSSEMGEIVIPRSIQSHTILDPQLNPARWPAVPSAAMSIGNSCRSEIPFPKSESVLPCFWVAGSKPASRDGSRPAGGSNNFAIRSKSRDNPLKRLEFRTEVRFGFRSAGFGFRSRRTLTLFRLVLISFRPILNSFHRSWGLEGALLGFASWVMAWNISKPERIRRSLNAIVYCS